ncbi:MAG: ribosomal protein S18-alanine N-acetyltransferase [Propionibacteriales bacterium]|nr:ribosomal protein S18-alanine N-acetyltransferase [Propionibacteriales bacterium]
MSGADMVDMINNSTMNIRPARDADLDAVLSWEESGFEPGERWPRASWAGELAADDRDVLVAEADGVPVGVITVQTVFPSSDLHRVLVASAWRRRGVARALVEAGVDAVRDRGARKMLLEVRYDNEPAIELYGRYGFEQLAVRKDYYGAGKDALIMKLYDLQEDA